MIAQEGAPRRIGILGLGCGTLAAYGRAGDTLRIYEINPQVLEIANRDFTYLKDTDAKVEVAMGDGRLVLESEPPQQFDMLVMDAFSGDSVPVHLITREAFAIYFRHLKPNGILAVNISNTYLNLEPVMERAANAFDKLALVYHWTPPEDDADVLLLFLDPDHGPRHRRRASRAAQGRQGSAPEAPVPHLDRRLLEHVQHPEVSRLLLVGEQPVGAPGEQHGVGMSSLLLADGGQGLKRLGGFAARARKVCFLHRENVAQQAIRLCVLLLCQAQQGEVALRNPRLRHAARARLLKNLECARHGMVGQGELILIHQDQAFLTEQGSDARVDRIELLFADRPRLAIERQRARIAARQAMDLRRIRIHHRGVQAVFAFDLERERQRLVGQPLRFGKSPLAGIYVREAAKRGGELYVSRIEFASRGDDLG